MPTYLRDVEFMEEILNSEDIEWSYREPFDANSFVAAMRVRAVLRAREEEPDGYEKALRAQRNGENSNGPPG